MVGEERKVTLRGWESTVSGAEFNISKPLSPPQGSLYKDTQLRGHRDCGAAHVIPNRCRALVLGCLCLPLLNPTEVIQASGGPARELLATPSPRTTQPQAVGKSILGMNVLSSLVCACL